MKTSTVVLIGAGVLAFLYFGNLGVAANVLQYYIQSVDFTGLTSGRIILVVQNPSNAAIMLNSMAGIITANGTTIGNISNFQGGVLIPANQQIPVRIDVQMSLGGLFTTLYTALTQPNGSNKIDFIISGNANINAGMEISFNIAQNVPV